MKKKLEHSHNSNCCKKTETVSFSKSFFPWNRAEETKLMKTSWVNKQSWVHYSTWTISRGFSLTHWGRVMHICVNKITIISSDNGLPPGRRQAIIWTSAGILLNGPLATIFSEILNEIHAFLSKKMHLKMSSVKWRQICLGLNELMKAAE